jgi:putative membrane protein
MGRPHRPGDPLADRRAVDEAQIDTEAVDNFKAVSPDNASELAALVRATGAGRLKALRRIALVAALAVVVGFVILLEAVDLVQRTNQLSAPLGTALTVVVAALILLLAWSVAASLLDYFRVRRQLAAEPLDIGALRRDAGLDLEGLRVTRAALETAFAHLGNGIDKNDADKLLEVHAELNSGPRDNTRRWLLHYDAEVLGVLDERVAGRIREEAVVIGLLTAISPRRGLTSLLVLWRQLRLVRSIAVVYGWRPGAVGTFALSRMALTNAALAAGFDELAHFAVQTIPGQAIAVAGGAMAAEALANAALTIRLARQAVNSCRPIRNREAAPYRVGLGRVMAEMAAKAKLAAVPA